MLLVNQTLRFLNQLYPNINRVNQADVLYGEILDSGL